MVRAVWSERQLQEVMVDFWFNHFDVFARKGAVRWMITAYERDAIRPHALGRFRDLLLATARHPAMLFSISTTGSVCAPTSACAPAVPRSAWTGLNENYAREILQPAHARRGRRLLPAGRCGGGAVLHRVEHRLPAPGRPVRLPGPRPRRRRQACAGAGVPGRGRESDGIRVIAILAPLPGHGPLHRRAARPPLRERRAAARGGGPGGRDLPSDGRRHPPGARRDHRIAGVLVGQGLPRQDQEAGGTRGQRGARGGRPARRGIDNRRRRHGPGPGGGRARRGRHTRPCRRRGTATPRRRG